MSNAKSVAAPAPPSPSPAEAAPAPARRRADGRRRRERFIGLLFVSPFCLVVVAFLLLPLAYALRMSLYTSTLAAGTHFSGLANYRKAFTDPEFLHGVERVIVFAVVQTPVMLALALVSALILDAVTGKLAKFFRLAMFMPYAVPAVIGALMWGFLYSPTFGPLHSVFHGSLLSGNLILTSLGNVATWQWAGYNMIILYAALQGMPREVYEAALVDGAGPVRTALRIKVPMISSALILCVVFSMIGALQFFTEPRVLRPLAPTISPSYTPNLYSFSLAFQYSQFNYSAAISFALGAVVFVGSYLFLFLTRKRSGLS
ncbi:carbohydrate ABC transporter permease [Actinoallomurus sp. CA-150999]|uniref:carbohydrate ABC transporter permease n=1 Tax=Actinoallomurus sp. CA-150999 TaxID=3239887 RepID=UPI003D8A38F5